MKRWAASVVAVVGGVLAGLILARRYRRFAVAGASMLPALREGDFVMVDMQAYVARPPVPRHVVVALDPRDETRTLVKRVGSYESGRGAWLLGDNPQESTDSRVFGFVPDRLILGRVLCRYWPTVRLLRSSPANQRPEVVEDPLA